MRQSTTKKTFIYQIKDTDGNLLDLINVLTYIKSDDGKDKLDRVDTFIGRSDRGEYINVGSTKDLSKPGVVFRYASYVREQEGLIRLYLDCYQSNLKGKVYTDTGSYYVI